VPITERPRRRPAGRAAARGRRDRGPVQGRRRLRGRPRPRGWTGTGATGGRSRPATPPCTAPRRRRPRA